MKDFYINFWDVTEGADRKWGGAHIEVHCEPYDEKRLNGIWSTDQKDVFGFGTGDNGWYGWQPKGMGTLYLYRPNANFKTQELSLIRFFNMDLKNGSVGEGMCQLPSPPAKGEKLKIHWELAITDKPSEEEPSDEENDKDYRKKVDNASVDIRNYVDKPELQEKVLKQAKEWVEKIKNQDIRKRVKEDLEETEKNYMHKHPKKK